MTFWGVLILISMGLAIYTALRHRSWRRLLSSAVLVFVGMLFPFFIFVMSVFLVPEWKGGCHRGWLDCFHAGKLALTPLVLWALAAFYSAQVLRPPGPPRPWVALGLYAGAVVSCFCAVFGLVVHLFQDEFTWWILVPLYTAAWYTVLAIRAMYASDLKPRAYLTTLMGSIPLWAASLIWSKTCYASLPEKAPSCFIVTSALKGHEPLVGPFRTIRHRGEVRIANRQLETFWHFESLWSRRAPRTHRVFRRAYNRIGPRIARRISSPFTADMVYLLIKPFEWLARAFVVRSGRPAKSPAA